ncbi:unnamed protein product [Linum tenue]|uniref:BHLH domain-containing protein n=1 Tax=Linum tenue TaxID=586396 RepID=A0AAV0ITE6_9ROSI|nr:unnamed protein product [Linum tenue]
MSKPPPCGIQQEAPQLQLQAMLQAAVQSVQWTYCIFWQFCPHQRILVWCDGYYNGAIKTRKTVQPVEVTAEEASLQRSQQLKELYESLLSTGEQAAAKRPCAALSPEDLTETEWFYLMCVSFSFPPGYGLPGKAYAKRQHVWLSGANEVDSKIYSRAILAKSARVQTVVCIPLLDGVLELGTTAKLQEDAGLIEHVKGFFTDQNYQHNPAPKPALSGHSTSDPVPSSDHPSSAFRSPLFPSTVFSPADDHTPAHDDDEEPDDLEIDEDDDEEQLEDDCENSDAEAEAEPPAAGSQPIELMQLDMSEDIRLGSPDDGGSNQLDSNFNLFGSQRWRSLMMEADCCGGIDFQPPQPMDQELSQEDTHYSQTVSAVLQNHHRLGRSGGWPTTTTSSTTACSPPQSAFATWTNYVAVADHPPELGTTTTTSQWALKYMLFNVPYLHAKHHPEEEKDSPKSGAGRVRDELSANHVMAERRRREKLNERFIVLRSLVPFVTKMDKASILGDTIEYLKQLRSKIQELEARNRQLAEPQRITRSEMKKKGRGAAAAAAAASVEVSIIERDALLELQCEHREGLLLDMMQKLREMRIEVTAVQSSLSSNGVLVAELRAKVKENAVRKKVSIVEVKRAIHEIIP